MFERFTEPARLSVVLAQEEARELGHDAIGVEHLLLGVARASPPVAGALGVGEGELRAAVVEFLGESAARHSAMPFTDAAKDVLQHALVVALYRGNQQIGPEHLMLALLASRPIADVLLRCGTVPDQVAAALGEIPGIE